MARTKEKQETQSQDPSEMERMEDLSKALNLQIQKTFTRLQADYGSTGILMCESANQAAENQDYTDFLFVFFECARNNMRQPQRPDDGCAYVNCFTTALLFYKMAHKEPINTPCSVERSLVQDRYLRRFLRELFRDSRS